MNQSWEEVKSLDSLKAYYICSLQRRKDNQSGHQVVHDGNRQ